jgi:hypothetical protein
MSQSIFRLLVFPLTLTAARLVAAAAHDEASIPFTVTNARAEFGPAVPSSAGYSVERTSARYGESSIGAPVYVLRDKAVFADVATICNDVIFADGFN